MTCEPTMVDAEEARLEAAAHAHWAFQQYAQCNDLGLAWHELSDNARADLRSAMRAALAEIE